MQIRASVISPPGTYRDKNEDNFCFNGKKLSGNSTIRPINYRGKTSSAVLMGKFDGMGGVKVGRRPSYIVSETA